MNQANHYLDVLVWLFGRPTSVFAQMETLGRDIATDDSCVVYLRWPNAMASLHVSMLTFPKTLESGLTLIGTNGSVQLGGPSCSDVRAWDVTSQETLDHILTQHRAVTRHGHVPIYEQVHDALDGKSPYSIETQDVLDVLCVVEAAMRSNERGAIEYL